MNDDARPAAAAARRSAEESCRETVLAVYGAIDAGRATAAVERYADDAVIETARGAAAGRAEIAELMAAREADAARATRHELSAVRVTLSGADEARLIAALTVYVLDASGRSGSPDSMSALDVRLTRAGDAWRIVRHLSTRLTDGGPS